MYDIKISQAQASIIAYDLYDVIVNAILPEKRQDEMDSTPFNRNECTNDEI